MFRLIVPLKKSVLEDLKKQNFQYENPIETKEHQYINSIQQYF